MALSFSPTNEQELIKNECILHSFLLIYALAGTGKTSTLEYIAIVYPEERGLYLAFGKSNQVDASKKFPKKNFKVLTTHALALHHLKRCTNINLSVIRGNYKEVEIGRLLGISYEDAKIGLSILNSFLNSTRVSITPKNKGSRLAKELFDMLESGKLTPTHSYYLKKFQLLLKEGVISLSFDILMLDESQDTNFVTLSICDSINAKHKILVGDDNQQIFSFRGSVNIMDKLVGPKVFYLTETFRFPEYIAANANNVLSKFKASEILIQSNVLVDKRYDLSQYEADEEIEAVVADMDTCYISRTNATLIYRMASFKRDGYVFKTLRHPNEIFSLSLDILNLSNDKRDKIYNNKFLLEFESLPDLGLYAKKINDIEIITAINIVATYGPLLFNLKEKAVEYYTAYEAGLVRGKKIFLTTAHTCKGLEWDYVLIENDFPDFMALVFNSGHSTIESFRKDVKNIDPKITDEFNLFYVALTRPRKSIKVEDANSLYLDKDDEYFNKALASIAQEVENAKQDGGSGFANLFPEAKRIKQNDTSTDENEVIRNNGGNFPIDNESLDRKNKRIAENKEALFSYSQTLSNWREAEVVGSSLLINGKTSGKEAIVGVRIGNGLKIHPMKMRVENGEAIIDNNTKWKESQLLVVDLIENVPEDCISAIGSSVVKLKKV